jgi:tRNA (cmo5U34)-methyltransferase
MADVIEPTSTWQRRYLAAAWDAVVREQSLALTGDLRGYEAFLADHWNLFEYPDPEMDKPSSVPEHLRWLAEAGYTGVDVFWSQAGHAIFGGYRPGAPDNGELSTGADDVHRRRQA